MGIKSSKTLVEEALKEVKTLDPAEVKKLYVQNLCNLIDIRDISELEEQGRIENAIHNSLGRI